jgi:uncharacterized protein
LSGHPAIRDDGSGGCIVAVKAVPGSSRDVVAGLLGDRLKIRVAAAPEGGKANASITALLAEALGVPKRSLLLAHGAASAEKSFRVEGLTSAEAARRLGGHRRAAEA